MILQNRNKAKYANAIVFGLFSIRHVEKSRERMQIENYVITICYEITINPFQLKEISAPAG